jgi:hypothetical protein
VRNVKYFIRNTRNTRILWLKAVDLALSSRKS